MVGYIAIDENNRVTRFDTVKTGYSNIKIEVDDDIVNSFKILCCYYVDGNLMFSKEDYDEMQMENAKLAEKQELNEAARNKIYDIISNLTHEQLMKLVNNN